MSKFRPQNFFARWRVAARTPRSKVTLSASASGDASAGAPIVICTLRSKVTVVAPPGKLGIHLSRSRNTTVSKVRTSSVLADQIFPGDRIVSIDGEDVGMMNLKEIVTIMVQKKECERVLVLLREQYDRDRVKDLANQNATLKVQVEEITKERDFLLEKREQGRRVFQALCKENTRLRDQDDTFSYEYDNDEESELEVVASERDQLERDLDEANAKISELKENLSSRKAIAAQRMQKENDELTNKVQSLTEENEKLAQEAEKRDILARKVDSLKKENQRLRQEVEVRKAQWEQQCILGDD